jgi:peptidoglycan biosynthesis protein MviN/MurJ (putative lipid II flippase)
VKGYGLFIGLFIVLIALPATFGITFGLGLQLGWWSCLSAGLSVGCVVLWVVLEDRLESSWNRFMSLVFLSWATLATIITYAVIGLIHGRVDGPLSLLFALTGLGLLSLEGLTMYAGAPPRMEYAKP